MATSEKMEDLDLRFFGAFEARVGGRLVAGQFYNKMRGLLACLTLERDRELSREFLASLLWEEVDPVTARGNLRRTLADLRRALEGSSGLQLFFTTKNAIAFRPQGAIDLIELMACSPQEPSAEEVVFKHYRGEFMAGLSLPDSPLFEEWLQLQREALNRRAVALLEGAAERHERAGNRDKVLQICLRQVELDRWNEDVHARIMRLYALKGEKSAAFRQYLFYCRMMERELGLPPALEMRRLAKQIRSEPASSVFVPRFPQVTHTVDERRQVTVLHCELSTASDDDPEEALQRLQELQAQCIDVLQEFSAHVVQSHGGTLLAYFGYPAPREHAAQHAVEAALGLTRHGFDGVEVRVGIHSGFVITQDQSSLPDAIGKTSGLAIQLRRVANDRETIISSDTFRLIKGYFHCDDLGDVSLHGITRRMGAFRVLQKTGARHRLEALGRLSPLVGREVELETLLTRWRNTQRGEGGVVLLQGEAGIGKTRLVETFMGCLVTEGVTVRELRCSPESAHSPFHPLIAMLESLYGFEPDDAPSVKLDKLSHCFDELYPKADRNVLLLLAHLLSIPVEDPVTLSPQEVRERLNGALLDLLQHLALNHPVLYVVEDLHWIDPSTLQLIHRFVEQPRKLPILMVLTARSEFTSPWAEDIVNTLHLAPLADPAIACLARHLDQGIPDDSLQRIVRRAEGIPLYAEEMVRMMAEQSNLDERAIPATLQDLLAVKLDGLGEAKRVAQLAATIGREFDVGLLRQIVPSASDLSGHLKALKGAGLILKEPKYRFKHALIADVAYQSQTRSSQQAAHRQIAHCLQNTESARSRPEVLAQHLACAGEIIPAIEAWMAAGKRASAQSALSEAAAHYRAGLSLVNALPGDDPHKNHLEYALQAALGVVLQAVQGYGSIEATATSQRSSILSELIEDCAEPFQTRWTRVMNTMARAGSREALTLAHTLLEETADNPIQLQAAHYAVADASFWAGEFNASRTHAKKSLALYIPAHHGVQVDQFGENLWVSCMSYLAWATFFLEGSGAALQLGHQGLEKARKLGHPHSLALALCFVSVLHRWSGLPRETLALS